jgi:outer membrane protein TolC
VQFGTKYSASAGASISQLIFSGNYLVGLQAAKTYLEQIQKEKVKTQIEVNRLVSETYFLLLATMESIAVIDSTLAITQRLANETGIIVSEGFAEETELDQLLLLVSELEISRDNALVQRDIVSALLRFHMGLEDDVKVVPTQSLSGLLGVFEPNLLVLHTFSPDENIEMQLLRKQQELSFLIVKREQSNYLPSLSAFLNYQTMAQRDVWDFFGDGKWYSSAVFGLTMSIPIFSSGERHAKVKQAQFQFEQTKIAEDQLRTNLKIQYESTLNELQTAWQTLNNTHQNKMLAERIFRRTGIKYREGVAGSLDLLNTHNQYLNAQSRYINAGLNLLNQQLAFETLLEKTQ